MTGLRRFDLHVHSRFSPDARTELHAIVDRLGVAGLNGFALTDHNTVAGHAEMKELGRAYPMYTFVPGVEVSTREGHLLVYGVSEVPPVGHPLTDTLDWVRARGAVAVLAHPFRWAHGVGRRLAQSARADGLEGMNGHNSELANARASLIAARRGLSSTGGSDAHDAPGVGRAYTEFGAGATTVDAVLDELRRAHAQPGGHSLSSLDRVRLGLRTGLLRASRGFRAI